MLPTDLSAAKTCHSITLLDTDQAKQPASPQMPQIMKIISNNPNLTRLAFCTFDLTVLSEAELVTLGSIISRHPSLQQLHFSGCQFGALTPSALAIAPQIFQQAAGVTTFFFMNSALNRLSPELFEDLIISILANRQRQELKIYKEQLTPEQRAILKKQLMGHVFLQRFACDDFSAAEIDEINLHLSCQPETDLQPAEDYCDTLLKQLGRAVQQRFFPPSCRLPEHLLLECGQLLIHALRYEPQSASVTLLTGYRQQQFANYRRSHPTCGLASTPLASVASPVHPLQQLAEPGQINTLLTLLETVARRYLPEAKQPPKSTPLDSKAIIALFNAAHADCQQRESMPTLQLSI